jgi:hypothetical protein
MVEGCAKGKEYSREVANPKVAAGLQQRFYAFRTALRRENQRIGLGNSRLTDMQQQRVADFLMFAERTVVWIERNEIPAQIKFTNVDNHPVAVMLRGFAVKEAPLIPTTEDELSRQARELFEKMNPSVEKKYG